MIARPARWLTVIVLAMGASLLASGPVAATGDGHGDRGGRAW